MIIQISILFFEGICTPARFFFRWELSGHEVVLQAISVAKLSPIGKYYTLAARASRSRAQTGWDASGGYHGYSVRYRQSELSSYDCICRHGVKALQTGVLTWDDRSAPRYGTGTVGRIRLGINQN
jgi:hypothetical protein